MLKVWFLCVQGEDKDVCYCGFEWLGLDFKNDVNYHRRANRQALHSIDQPNVAVLGPKNLDKQI